MFFAFSIACNAVCANAELNSAFKIADTPTGDVIEFVQGEYAIAKGYVSPSEGWWVDSNPRLDLKNLTRLPTGQYRSLIGRFTFDRGDVGSGLLAIYTIGTRGNFTVFVNDTEVFRNFADISDKKNPWYRPFIIPIPDFVLQDSANELVIHSFSQKSVGIGRLLVGPNSDLQELYQSRYFWHITGPTAASFAMLVIGMLFFAFWIVRKHEIELLWLAIASTLWFARNHQYFAEEIPFHTKTYVAITFLATYFGTVAIAGFYFYFIRLRHRKILIGAMLLAGVFIVLFHFGILRGPTFFGVIRISAFSNYFGTLLVILTISFAALWDLKKQHSSERTLLGLGVVTLMPLVTIHDITMLIRYGGDGHAIYLALFSAPLYSIIFSLSFGIRVSKVFTSLSRYNTTLEENVAQARAELLESEAQRQELIVAQTLDQERTRLMQEMHDGIGSNLTTALAVAQKQKHPNSTVTVLKKALGDLKLTVDSLEPVEGDLVALIGNLRHRMARDIADAGIQCKWEVEDCEPLQWLDATNALHVLRIHNEAISNILAHSKASEIRIGCVESDQNKIRGVLTYIADNGVGFDEENQARGKGMPGMKARAHALQGTLSSVSRPGRGTRIELWLPYDREDVVKTSDKASH